MGPGNQGFVELNGVGGLVLGAASVEVADHAGKGRQPEAGLDDPLDEVVGFGRGLALVLGAGPFEALLFGHAVEDYLGAGQDQFAAEGADAGP